MKTIWLIANSRSGTTTEERTTAIIAQLAESGAMMAGQTSFPDDPLPDAAALDAVAVDTVVLFAGDGTINAACKALADWHGAILILPGGTMNMLAKQLHGDRDPASIIADAAGAGGTTTLPIIKAGEHIGYVGLIIGPAASWVHAREDARAGRWARLPLAIRLAWRRTFEQRVRITGVPALAAPAQAVFVRAGSDGLLVRAVDAPDWRQIAELGWSWLTGDWVDADPVQEARTLSFGVAGRKPVLTLFDGEPVQLEPGTEIKIGRSPAQFIATRDQAA